MTRPINVKMAKKIENTMVPRNPVARSPLMRRGGAHQPKRSTQRRNERDVVRGELENWRDELDDLRQNSASDEADEA